MASIREVLAGSDASSQAELLINLLNEAAGGRDLHNSITEVIETAITIPYTDVRVRKLAYDLCKVVTLSPSDCELLLLTGVKNDLSNGAAETQTAALEVLPSMPERHLVAFLQRGDVNTLVAPLMKSTSAEVRAAAVESLAFINVLPEVLRGIAQNLPLLANATQHWDDIVDALIDSEPQVVLSAVGGMVRLLQAVDSTSPLTGQNHLLQNQANRAVQRAASCLGPVLEMCSLLPNAGQVCVAIMLRGLVLALHHMQPHAFVPGKAGGAAKDSLPDWDGGEAKPLVPSLSSALSAACSYLHTHVRSADPAVRLECARSLLDIVWGCKESPEGVCVELVSSSWVEAAIGALLELRDRQLVEAGLEEVVFTIARHLKSLPVESRWRVLQHLWPLIPHLQMIGQRIAAYALAWKAALEMDLDMRMAVHRGGRVVDQCSLSQTLEDAYLKELLSDRHLSGQATPPRLSQGLASEAVQESGGLLGSVAVPGAGAAQAAAQAAAEHMKESMKNTAAEIERRADALKSLFKKNRSPSSRLDTQSVTPTEPVGESKFSSPSTLRHEVVCTLLEVVRCHSAAVIAMELCLEVQRVRESGQQVVPRTPTEAEVGSVHWISAASAVLQWSAPAITWEPFVAPGIVSIVNAQDPAAGGGTPADLSSVPADCWLQTLSTCCHAVDAMQVLLRDNKNATIGSFIIQPQALALSVQMEHRSLCGLMRALLKQWANLARALRPRLVWVLARHLDLPPAIDEAWVDLMSCLNDLVVALAAGVVEERCKELSGSVQEGRLLRAANRQMFSGAKGNALAQFDPFAASALIELPEYELLGQEVGLVVVQYLAVKLQDMISKGGMYQGLKVRRTDIASLGEGLVGVLQRYMTLEGAGPDVKEWGKRLRKVLAAVTASGAQQVEEEADGDTSGASSPAAEGEVPAAKGAIAEGAGGAASMALQAPWGFPFTGPRTLVLFNAKRSRRHRHLSAHLQTALMTLQERSGKIDSTVVGPVLASNSSMRLDEQTFWRGLGVSDRQQLTGPGDPVLIMGGYETIPGEPSLVRIRLEAVNRLTSDLSGVEVQMKTSGSIFTDRRSLTWNLPKLSPGESVRHTFNLKLLGYNRMEVACRLQLTSSNPYEVLHNFLVASPLRISMVDILHPPQRSCSVDHFFRMWDTLPARAELSGVCNWPGIDGLLLMFSALMSAPLTSVYLQAMPALGGCHGGFVAETAHGESVALMVVAQLMPDTDEPASGPPRQPQIWQPQQQGKAAGEAGTITVCQVYVRSTCYDVPSAARQFTGEWLSDLSGGTLSSGLAGPRGGGGGGGRRAVGTKPQLHPTMAGLRSLFMNKPKVNLGMLGLAAAAGRMSAEAVPAAAAAAPPSRWVRSAALGEWQRIAVL